MSNDAKQLWDTYRTQELAGLTPIVESLGYSLDIAQLHISGERYLMSGKKLVLTGVRTTDSAKVIIKSSSDHVGAKEIADEHDTRDLLSKLPFAYGTLLSPTELLFTKQDGYTISITSFLEQEKNFLDRPLAEQFSLALRALEAQERVHATTYGHAKIIKNTFGIWGAKEYRRSFLDLKQKVTETDPTNTHLADLLTRAQDFFEQYKETVEQYAGFLTHTDFVPHNLRVVGNDIYLLDHTSLKFGNKYESWARFLNFMLLYNPPLEQAFVQYVQENRTPEEYLSLRLMRIYKLMFLLSFYSASAAHTSGDLYTLTQERIALWSQVLEAILEDKTLAPGVLHIYKEKRDALRSPEEKERQQKLH